MNSARSVYLFDVWHDFDFFFCIFFIICAATAAHQYFKGFFHHTNDCYIACLTRQGTHIIIAQTASHSLHVDVGKQSAVVVRIGTPKL